MRLSLCQKFGFLGVIFLCVRAKDNRKAAKYCVFTHAIAEKYDSISLITTPEFAVDYTQVLVDLSSAWECRGVNSAPGAAGPDAFSYEVTDVPGKGKGLVTRRVFHRGELIIREFPKVLASLDYMDTFSSRQLHLLLQAAFD